MEKIRVKMRNIIYMLGQLDKEMNTTLDLIRENADSLTADDINEIYKYNEEINDFLNKI